MSVHRAWMAGLALLAIGCTPSWVYVAEAPEQADTSSFAQSVALEGELALIGNSQSADLYERPPDGSSLPPHLWVHIQRFTPAQGAPPGLFGKAVALSGDRLFIGAPWGEPQVIDNGYVDVYDRVGGTWTFTQRVTPESFDPPPGFGPEILFGNALAVQGDELFVGAHHYGDTAGRVFVFERVGGLYQQTHELKPPSDVQETAFGETIRVSGDTLAISRRGPGGAGTGGGTPIVPGEVHVFIKSDGEWVPQQVLFSPTSAPDDLFGSGIDLHGDRLVVLEETAVHLFERSGGVWSAIWQRPVTDGGRKPVAFRPSTGTVPGYLFVSNEDTVQVLIEATDGSGYTPQGVLPDPDAQPGFGSALSLSGDRLLVAATGGGTARARIFERDTGGTRLQIIAIDDEILRRTTAAMAEEIAASPELQRQLDAALEGSREATQALATVAERHGLTVHHRSATLLLVDTEGNKAQLGRSKDGNTIIVQGFER